MAATPPTPPPDETTRPTAPPGGPGGGPGGPPMGYTAISNLSLARMPMPGNAEFTFVILAAIALGILAWVADGIRDTDWFDWFKWIAAAYLISRGIAKASRVLEQ